MMGDWHNPDDVKARQASYEKMYQGLRREYVRRLQNAVAAIDNILGQRQWGPFTRDDLLRAEMLVHGMAGTGATFGFPDVSDAGHRADIRVEQWLRTMPGDGVLDDAHYAELETLLRALQTVCAGAVARAGGCTQDADDADPRVVVIGSSPDMVRTLAAHLSAGGMCVTHAADGPSAITMMQKAIPDLILLDNAVPGPDGHEVLCRLKQDPAFVHVPVIVMLGAGGGADRDDVLHCGAADFIIGPPDPADLERRIMNILEGRVQGRTS